MRRQIMGVDRSIDKGADNLSEHKAYNGSQFGYESMYKILAERSSADGPQRRKDSTIR